MKQGFDNETYIKKQSEQIRKRIGEFGGKLYLDFGGKLFDDYHASRVLPGFAPDVKLQMLRTMREQAEIVIAINAGDIAKNKLRGDLGIPYDADVLRLIDAFRDFGLYVGSVVMTQFQGQPAAVAFEQKLRRLGLPVFRHYVIDNYPYDIERIVSEEGYGRNEYIETTRPLVVVTAPGPGSGKMATCLSQLYHEHLRGVTAGYAKYETFPIWNLPLKHPVNLAYEAATADLSDVNMIDPYHLEAYGVTTVNYNRDVEIFPVLSALFERISGSCPYKSPTDMGVNMAGYCIVDDDACREASKAEIVRRYYTAMTDCAKGRDAEGAVQKIESIMHQMGLSAPPPPSAGLPRQTTSLPLPSSCPTAAWSPARRAICWALRRLPCSTPSRRWAALTSPFTSSRPKSSNPSRSSKPGCWATTTRAFIPTRCSSRWPSALRQTPARPKPCASCQSCAAAKPIPALFCHRSTKRFTAALA